MRIRTGIGMLVFLLALGGVAFLAFDGGGTTSGELTEEWVSDTAVSIQGNHHAPAAGRVRDGQPMVYAPLSGAGGTTECGLFGLSARNGTTQWQYQVPPANCTIHSIADPTLADYDGDGTQEVIAATTEQSVVALKPTSGTVEFRYNLTDYGYTQPLVTDFVGDATKEIIVLDVKGSVFVLRPNGTAVWQKNLSAYTWGQPAVADFDADGAPELAVGLGNGGVSLFERNGSIAWQRPTMFANSVTWMTTGQIDGDQPIEIVVGTPDGVVAAVDGSSNEVEWRQQFGTYAAVHAVGDGDGDGDVEVYAVATDGKLRSLQGTDGTVEWTTTLTTKDVQMTPPPSLGDMNGDGQPELLAVTNNGIISVVNPKTGNVMDSYEREVPIYTHPTLADTDNDGRKEGFVIYGDGRVVAFSYSTS